MFSISPQRFTKRRASCREILDGLRKRGFKLNTGINGTGFGMLGDSQVPSPSKKSPN